MVAPRKTDAAVTVSIGRNFTGSTFGLNSQSLPPDSGGTIGPGRFMEFINGTVAVYNSTNGASVQRKTNLKFWTDAGVLLSSETVTTDPRVIYDPVSKRWFAVQVDFNGSAGDPTAEANDFLIAVSKTSSPTGQWKGFLFQADPDNGYFADFPTLGMDSNTVYISGDFYSAGEQPRGAGLVSIPKADLIAATPTIDNMTWFGVMDYAERGEVVQPAICFDASARGSMLSIGDIGYDSSPHTKLVCFAVQDAGGASPMLTASTFLEVLPYEVPDNVDLGVPQFTALQPDGSTTLMANDARLSSQVYAVNGILYATHTTLLNGRLAIRWYRVRASDHTLVEQGTITEPDRDLFFPSIAVNPYGVVVIGCNGSGLNTAPSSFAYVGEIANGTTTFGSAILLKAGAGSYHDFFEILAELLDDPVTPSRWGDYSATSVDPADPSRFWTIQAYPSSVDPDTGGTWSTQITEIIATTPPILTISQAGANVVVSWPIHAANYHLETSATLSAMNSWSLISAGITTNGPTLSALVPKSTATKFFRLKYP